MHRCPACHALYPDSDRFCEVDGETLVIERDKKLSAIPTLPAAEPPRDIPLAGPETPTLASKAGSLSPDRIPELVAQTIALGRRFEAAGLAWQPQPEDFVLADAELRIVSARGVFRRLGPFDVRPALRALGEALLEAPAALCATSVVRLLSDPSLPSLSPDDAHMMVNARESLAPVAAGPAAVLAHLGYRRAIQQDFVELRSGEGVMVLTLCDGVSGSSDGALAARVGSAVAADRAMALSSSHTPGEVVRDAILAAHQAVIAAAKTPRRTSRPPGPLSADRTRESPLPSQEPPGSTIVVALIREVKDGAEVAIGWAGDSRAYVTQPKPELLTLDHSWANAMLATGHVTPEEAFAQPLAHALTRCIGPLDEPGNDLIPDVRVQTLPHGATLVLCSDGVWSYLAKPESVAGIVALASGAAPIARALVHEALLHGGHDNASVAVYVVR